MSKSKKMYNVQASKEFGRKKKSSTYEASKSIRRSNSDFCEMSLHTRVKDTRKSRAQSKNDFRREVAEYLG